MTTTDTLPQLLDDREVAFLTQEMDRLLGLYSQAQANIQSVFNFYLTFITAVVGGVIVVVQLSPQTAADVVGSRLTLVGLLFFAAIVGSVYLSALAGRYAHAQRFAHAVDSIRYYLITHLQIDVPPVYSRFVQEHRVQPAEVPMKWYLWLFPTGTYQMFIAIINSAALAAMTWIIFSAVNEHGRGLLGVVLVFVLSLTVFNTYSRLVIRRFTTRLHLRIDAAYELALWAARE